ncbi:hypothetical protein AWB98_20575 [Mycolicibacterium conceptionense]|uniref:UvrD-like helicase C-terminal domain-containing protein n=1 Tax=Mycolicibacterium conceptionense TaxID=451644 RepID=A0ABX3V5I4_9MYCO|nr:3'-5' exonuclease [Mycolicibacterium conceptionense]ORV24643.1 hypothetical protein AWB98_20575 [Mycolicibacterium conceptionense]
MKKGPGRRPLSAKRQRFMELRARGWSVRAAARISVGGDELDTRLQDLPRGRYSELARLASRSSATDDEASSRFDSRLKRLLRTLRDKVRGSEFDAAEFAAWTALVDEFLQLLSRPALIALAPGYQQGTRLDDVIDEALQAFNRELAVDGDAAQALRRLSDQDAIRLLTIHKCKGLEFDKVVVVGVEEQLFWGDPTAVMSEFFVAISRAKSHLVLTHARRRDRPAGTTTRWDLRRQGHQKLLGFARGG